jgi:hypothetical protein
MLENAFFNNNDIFESPNRDEKNRDFAIARVNATLVK